MINFMKNNWKGIVLSLFVAVPSWFLGGIFPIIGGPVIGIVLGIIIGLFLKKDAFASGIAFTSKKILQLAVVLLGFGLNLNVVLQTGKQSLPIILATISVSLIIAFVMGKVFRVPAKIATLVGVGSSICGGSAIAATAPVIQADDNEVASSISVIFLFNVLAAILFPILGKLIGFSTECGEAFGIFAGTAINDTSSVTAAASTWDSLYNLGSMTLDKAVTVKLTRTLAIIPITLTLAFIQAKKENNKTSAFSFRRAFPMFIPYFVLASLITTVALYFGADASIFKPFKILSKFFIVLAMSAIGLNTNIIALVKNGGKALLLGFCCWTGITAVSLLLQHIMKIW